MEMKNGKTKIIISMITLIIFATACAATPATQPAAEKTAPEAAAPGKSTAIPTIIPTFVAYPTPPFTSSEGAFVFGGCRADTLECPPESLIGGLGCEHVVVRDVTGGMTPPVPAAWCIVERGQPPDTLLFQRMPGTLPAYRAYIIYRDDMFQLVNKKDLQALYAPIDSPDEALNFALLLTDFYGEFNLRLDPQVQYLVPKIEETHVTQTPDGYQIRLFSDETRMVDDRCSSTITSAMDVLIAKDGKITILTTQPQWSIVTCV